MKNMDVLYLSYDGMTDPLGQSQVIPYLEGLSACGYSITLVSFEKPLRFDRQKEQISILLSKAGIRWEPLLYTKYPPVLATLWDLFRLKRKVRSLQREKSFRLVHCRSYITSLAGLYLKRKFGIKFIFDMRGYWADERVEGKIWDIRNPVYRAVYNYFKKKETEFLSRADFIVSLTDNSRLELEGRKLKPGGKLPVQVIPCCADLNHFSPEGISEVQKTSLKHKLFIPEQAFILGYLGAIGTWYMLDEMLDFFACLLKEKPAAVFLFITEGEAGMIRKSADKKGIPEEKIMITGASRQELPALLSIIDVSIFFILPVFSKRASSPTKQGELMGMGIPLICNSGIGDTDKIIMGSNAGLIVDNFTSEDYRSAAKRLDSLMGLDRNRIREGAQNYYSLEKGILLYREIYDQLTA